MNKLNRFHSIVSLVKNACPSVVRNSYALSAIYPRSYRSFSQANTEALVSNTDAMQLKIQNLEAKLKERDTGSKSASAAPLTHQRYAGRKRFYKHVGVEAVGDGVHFRVTLDGKVLRTPGRNPLHLPSKELALLIAAEWDHQTDPRKGIEPTTMPIMTLLSTAIDQIQFNDNTATTPIEDLDTSQITKTVVIENCLKYLPTDTLLFFTTESDRILVNKQRKYLSPIIKGLNRSIFGEAALTPTTDVTSKVKHSEETVNRIRGILQRMDHITLACTQAITMECKSLLMAVAYVAELVSLEQLIVASRLEEEFQVEIWGVVEGGHDMDRLNQSVALNSVALVLSTLYDPIYTNNHFPGHNGEKSSADLIHPKLQEILGQKKKK